MNTGTDVDVRKTSNSSDEILEQFKKDESVGAYSSRYPNKHPCPSCGHCPSCGRGGLQFPNYPVYPYYPSYPTQPWITYSSGHIQQLPILESARRARE